MALGEWAYHAKHIPGSLHFATMREALHSLNKEDEIVVYCSEASCIASAALGQLLERHGYTHVLHFAGGLRTQRAYLQHTPHGIKRSSTWRGMISNARSSTCEQRRTSLLSGSGNGQRTS